MPDPIEFELTAKDAQLDLTLRKQGKLADELGEKLEKAGQRSKRGADDAANALKRQRKETEDLSRDVDKTTASVKRVGQATEESFGANAAANVARMAAQYISVATAVAMVRKELDLVAEAKNKAVASGEAQSVIRGKLATMARSPAEAAALYERADKGAVLGGVSRERSAQVLYNLMNAGRESEFEKVMRVSPLMPPEELSEATARLPKLLNSKRSGMTLSNMVFEAGREAYADPSELLREMPTAATGKKFIGGDDAEVITLLGQMTDLTKSPRIAADRLRHFGLHMGHDQRFAGKGFVHAVKTLQGMSPEERDPLIKADELREAYELMSQGLPDYERRRAAVVKAGELAGTDQAPIEVALQAQLGVPSEKAKYKGRQAGQREEIAREKNLGLPSTITEQIFKDQRARDEANKANMSVRLGRSVAQGIAWKLDLNPEAAMHASEAGAQLQNWNLPGAAREWWKMGQGLGREMFQPETMDRTNQLLQEISGKLNPPPIPARPPNPHPPKR